MVRYHAKRNWHSVMRRNSFGFQNHRLVLVFGFFMVVLVWTQFQAPVIYGDGQDAARDGIEFVLLQFGDEKAVQKYSKFIQSVRDYAEAHRYQYELKVIDKYVKRTKPVVILEALKALTTFQTLVVLDLDMKIMQPAMTMRTIRAGVMGSCGFVAQDSNHTINSGFLMLKPMPEVFELVQDWIGYFDLNGGHATFDQFMLQEAMLKQAENRKDDPLKNVCYSPGLPFDTINFCYNDRMRAKGHPLDSRSFGRFCFLDHRHRINMHDSGDTYCFGDFILHAKTESWLIVQYMRQLYLKLTLYC